MRKIILVIGIVLVIIIIFFVMKTLFIKEKPVIVEPKSLSISEISTIAEFTKFIQTDSMRFCEEDRDCTIIVANCTNKGICGGPCKPLTAINKNKSNELNSKRDELCASIWETSKSEGRKPDCLFIKDYPSYCFEKLICLNNKCEIVPLNKTRYCDNASDPRIVYTDPSLKNNDECMRNLADELNEFEICYQIENEHNMNVCLYDHITNSGNPELCEEIPNLTVKAGCYFEFAKKYQDDTLCAKANREEGCYNRPN